VAEIRASGRGPSSHDVAHKSVSSRRSSRCCSKAPRMTTTTIFGSVPCATRRKRTKESNSRVPCRPFQSPPADAHKFKKYTGYFHPSNGLPAYAAVLDQRGPPIGRRGISGATRGACPFGSCTCWTEGIACPLEVAAIFRNLTPPPVCDASNRPKDECIGQHTYDAFSVSQKFRVSALFGPIFVYHTPVLPQSNRRPELLLRH
jgi:hypothetical protein